MKKVLHILNSLQPSGAETMLYSSALLWDDYDKNILITVPERGSYAEQLEKAGYHLWQIADHNFFVRHRLTRKYIKEEKFDVVHIHRESESVFYVLDAKMAGCKHIVQTIHNVFKFRGILRYRRILTRYCSRFMGSKMIAIGKSVYENEKYWLKNEPFRLINNWCNEEKFYPVTEEERRLARERLNIGDDIFCMVSVGNCSEIKNHQYILQTLKDLGQKKIIYLHVGKGSDEEKEKQYVIDNHLENQVVFVGHEEPRIYLAAADLFVMPSQNEGLSISGLEAIYVGIPTLFTNVVGLKDFSEIDKQAVLFSEYDQESFTEAVKQIYDNFCKGNKIDCSDAIKKVRQIYNMKQSVKEYLQVYES